MPLTFLELPLEIRELVYSFYAPEVRMSYVVPDKYAPIDRGSSTRRSVDRVQFAERKDGLENSEARIWGNRSAALLRSSRAVRNDFLELIAQKNVLNIMHSLDCFTSLPRAIALENIPGLLRTKLKGVAFRRRCPRFTLENEPVDRSLGQIRKIFPEVEFVRLEIVFPTYGCQGFRCSTEKDRQWAAKVRGFAVMERYQDQFKQAKNAGLKLKLSILFQYKHSSRTHCRWSFARKHVLVEAWVVELREPVNRPEDISTRVFEQQHWSVSRPADETVVIFWSDAQWKDRSNNKDYCAD